MFFDKTTFAQKLSNAQVVLTEKYEEWSKDPSNMRRSCWRSPSFDSWSSQIFKEAITECLTWESDEEQERMYDYMRTHASSEQIEKHFGTKRGKAPVYESWTAYDALLALLGYRNSPRLSQKTVMAHREEILSYTSRFADEDMTWSYTDSYTLKDRGYDIMSYSVFADARTYLDAVVKLMEAKYAQEKAERTLEESIQEVNAFTQQLNDILSGLGHLVQQ